MATIYQFFPPSITRLLQDSAARLVLAGVAEKRAYSHALGLDDYRDIRVPASLPHELAPFTDVAGVGRMAEAESFDMECLDHDVSGPYTADRRRASTSVVVASRLRGKATPIRTGGKLRPVTASAAPSRKVKPAKRCDITDCLPFEC